MRPLVRNPAWNTTRQRAAQVFVESVVCGYVIGFGVAFLVALVLVAGNTNSGVALVAYPFFAGGGAGTLGLLVGLLVGALGCGLVRTGERRLGALAVAWLLPAVGLAVSLPIALLCALPGNGGWRAGVLCVATVLSLTGSSVVASRYLRRAEWPPVH